MPPEDDEPVDAAEGPDGEASPADTPPEDVIDEAERLSRLARDAVDDAEAAAYREERDSLLAEHGYETRVREDDGRAALAAYPQEWVEDGTVQMDRVDDVSRGVERPLEGPGTADEWEDVEAHNRELADRVRERHGDVHGQTAAALADFASNHYAKAIDRLTEDELASFETDYFPRNAWPSDEQRDRLAESIRLTVQAAESESATDE